MSVLPGQRVFVIPAWDQLGPVAAASGRGVVEAAELKGSLHARADRGVCPRYGQPSGRVHSMYGQRLADAPVGGQRVLIRLAVRRFFCGNPDCPAVMCAKQIDGLTSRRPGGPLRWDGSSPGSRWPWPTGPGRGSPQCWTWPPGDPDHAQVPPSIPGRTRQVTTGQDPTDVAFAVTSAARLLHYESDKAARFACKHSPMMPGCQATQWPENSGAISECYGQTQGGRRGDARFATLRRLHAGKCASP